MQLPKTWLRWYWMLPLPELWTCDAWPAPCGKILSLVLEMSCLMHCGHEAAQEVMWKQRRQLQVTCNPSKLNIVIYSILRLWIPVNCKDYTLVWILNTLNTVIFLWNVYWRQRVFCQDECARRSLRLLDHITDEAFDTQAADCLWKKMRGVRVECKKNVRKKRSSNFWTWKNTRSLTTQEKVSCCIAENGAYLSSNVALFRCLWRFQV